MLIKDDVQQCKASRAKRSLRSDTMSRGLYFVLVILLWAGWTESLSVCVWAGRDRNQSCSIRESSPEWFSSGFLYLYEMNVTNLL